MNLGESINNIADKMTSAPFLNKIMNNPFYMAAFIVFVMVICVVIVFQVSIFASTMLKFIAYGFILMSVVIFLYNRVITANAVDKMSTGITGQYEYGGNSNGEWSSPYNILGGGGNAGPINGYNTVNAQQNQQQIMNPYIQSQTAQMQTPQMQTPQMQTQQMQTPQIQTPQIQTQNTQGAGISPQLSTGAQYMQPAPVYSGYGQNTNQYQMMRKF